ncbi:MAG: hypothetical protein M1449_04330 [Candidatus Thermoplasmatota archaeon]|nr:hypothetical protein [Candidatus Thermoplasmatota archaeon]
MLKSVQTILHPPELKGRERRRYWIAVGGWFAVILGLLSILGSALLLVVGWLEGHFGTAALSPYGSLILACVLIIGVASVLGGDRLWLRLFILSGYLSDAATIRLMSNRAPSAVSERRHRWLGPALLIVIYGMVGFMGFMARQWWVLFVALPLLVWGLYLIRNAWKQADEMLSGGAIPPESEDRIGQIEQVLEARRKKGQENRSL